MRSASKMFSLAGRDSVLSLCDGTERGYASFNDEAIVGRGIMESNTLTLRGFNSGMSMQLHARYELIAHGCCSRPSRGRTGRL